MDKKERTIIHLDLDAFFVSVECLRDNRLRGKPLIIGGSSDRGVVASCSYEARKFGIRSAMPIKMAKQLCPDALIISGDMEAYSKHSKAVTSIVAEQAPVFEKASIDEFYLDISGMDKFFGCFKWGLELREKIIKETGLIISMGVSANKMISKVATGESKPDGKLQVERGTETSFLDPLKVEKIPMIGEKTAQFLNNMGVINIKTLREMPVEMLHAAFGKNGTVLWQRANGIDESPVEPYTERKSISTETTFESDTIDVKMLKCVLIAMVEKLTFKLRSERKLCSCISVKIRYSNFDTESKQLHIPYTSSDQSLIKTALELFDKLYQRRMLIRLIGVRLSSLVHGHYQINLFEDTEESIRLYQAMDKIKHKYGADVLFRAAGLAIPKRIKNENNLFLK
jgi:DNA polymerase IV